MMGNTLRNLRNIKTVRNQASRAKAETPQWIKAELASLKAEKAGLIFEKKKYEMALERIKKRIKEINQGEQWLAQIISAKEDESEERDAPNNASGNVEEMVIKY